MADYIKKSFAIECVDKIIQRDDSGNNDVVNALKAWKSFIEYAPTENVEPVRYGQWILCDKQDLNDVVNDNYLYECSECKSKDLHSKSAIVPYCWHCGSYMTVQR